LDLGTFPSAGFTVPGITPSRSHGPDLEQSRPPSPTDDTGAVDVVPSWKEPVMNRFRLMAVFIASLVCGLNDAAAGALIPYMEV
jgi:hypothetical protein